MVAGLPGTGIGGLFYLLLAALMPLKHVGRVLTRRPRPTVGRRVGAPLAYAAAILATLWAQAWAVKHAVLVLAPSLAASGGPLGLADGSTSTYVKAAAFASAASLAAVVLLVHLLRLLVQRPAPVTTVVSSAEPAHRSRPNAAA